MVTPIEIPVSRQPITVAWGTSVANAINTSQYDTGWLSLPLPTNFVVSGSSHKYRRIGSSVVVLVSMSRTGGDITTPTTVTIPAMSNSSCWPSGASILSTYTVTAPAPTVMRRIWVSTNGSIPVESLLCNIGGIVNASFAYFVG